MKKTRVPALPVDEKRMILRSLV